MVMPLTQRAAYTDLYQLSTFSLLLRFHFLPDYVIQKGQYMYYCCCFDCWHTQSERCERQNNSSSWY